MICGTSPLSQKKLYGSSPAIRALFAAVFSIFFITLIVFVWSLQSGPIPIIVEGVLVGAMALLALRGRRLTPTLRRNLRRVFWLFFVAITISVIAWVREVGPVLPVVTEVVVLVVALFVMRWTRTPEDPELGS